MASTSSFGSSTGLTFDTTSPSTNDNKGNDSFFVTSNGLNNGTVEEFWKFDGDSQSWIQIPLGSSCPDPMTRGVLISLRNSGNLSENCHYIINDYNRGTVGSATILLHATASDELSLNAHIKTTFDNSAWAGTYDIDTNRIESLHDNLGNDVYGQDSVDTFPWGKTSVIENEVREGRLNYTAGTFRENFIGGGTTVTHVAGTSEQNNFEQNASIRVEGGTFNQNTVDNDSNVTVRSGTNIHNTFASSTFYNQVGTGYLRYCELGSNITVTNGNTNIYNTKIFDTDFNTTGSTGTIARTTFNNGYAVRMTNVPSLNIFESSFSARSHIQVNNATLVRLYRCTGDASGRFLASPNASLNCSYSKASNYGYIQCVRGSMVCNYSDATSLGYISHQSTGTNNVDRCNVTSQSNIRFLDSATSGRVYYSSTSAGASIYHNGTSNGCIHYYCNASSVAQMYMQNTVNGRHYYNNADSYSYIRVYGTNSGQSIMYYCNASARGYVEHLNITAQQRFYAVSANAQSIIRQTGGAAAANTYYSSAHSYYYMLLTNSGVTRYGLDGFGRQSYTGQPVTNGTGQRNWT